MSERPWYGERFDEDYLEVYAHRNEDEAERATTALFVPLGLAGRWVLDLGCGGGRYTRALDRHGAIAVGLDLSMPLLRAAGAAGVTRRVRADMRMLPFGGERFDLVACMFTSFGYFANAAEDARVLSEAARVLRPNGAFVLDTFNPPHAIRTLVARSERQSAGLTIVEERRVEGDCIVKTIELRRGDSVRHAEERVRLWPTAALTTALAGAGFTVEAIVGDYEGTPFDAPSSVRRIVRARRRP